VPPSLHLQSGLTVAQRNSVVAKLLAATDAVMDGQVKKPGTKELAAAFP
jgi:hypothetical protein